MKRYSLAHCALQNMITPIYHCIVISLPACILFHSSLFLRRRNRADIAGSYRPSFFPRFSFISLLLQSSSALRCHCLFLLSLLLSSDEPLHFQYFTEAQYLLRRLYFLYQSERFLHIFPESHMMNYAYHWFDIYISFWVHIFRIMVEYRYSVFDIALPISYAFSSVFESLRLLHETLYSSSLARDSDFFH